MTPSSISRVLSALLLLFLSTLYGVIVRLHGQHAGETARGANRAYGGLIQSMMVSNPSTRSWLEEATSTANANVQPQWLATNTSLRRFYGNITRKASTGSHFFLPGYFPSSPDDFYPRFCSALNGRNIMVIGDSLAGQFHHVVRDLAGPRFFKHDKPNAGFGPCYYTAIVRQNVSCKGHDICGVHSGSAAAKVYYRRSFFLQLPESYPAMNEEPFHKQIDTLNISVAIIHIGHHYQPWQQFASSIRRGLQALVERYPELHIFVHNINSGHVDCRIYTGPVPSLLPIPAGYKGYHWDDFPSHNEKLAALLQDEFPPNRYRVQLSDIATPTNLRPDGHLYPHNGDCLHYAIESGATALDHWVIQLYEDLRQMDN